MADSDVGAVLGRVASGVYILTIRHGDFETGMLASWVMQAGFEPPMVTVAVRRGRYVGEWIEAGAAFVLNVVRADDKRLLRHFGKGFEIGEPAFEGLEVTRAASGAAKLGDVVGHLECRATGHVDSGDHRIYLAEVLRGELLSDAPPMVHVRKSGMHY